MTDQEKIEVLAQYLSIAWCRGRLSIAIPMDPKSQALEKSIQEMALNRAPQWMKAAECLLNKLNDA